MTDPHLIPGDMVGSGGPHEQGQVLLDARHAILMDSMEVSTLDRADHFAIAMVLRGRINQTQDRANVLFIFGSDGAAAIITELLALIGRATGRKGTSEFVGRFMADLEERFNALDEEGSMDRAE